MQKSYRAKALILALLTLISFALTGCATNLAATNRLTNGTSVALGEKAEFEVTLENNTDRKLVAFPVLSTKEGLKPKYVFDVDLSISQTAASSAVDALRVATVVSTRDSTTIFQPPIYQPTVADVGATLGAAFANIDFSKIFEYLASDVGIQNMIKNMLNDDYSEEEIVNSIYSLFVNTELAVTKERIQEMYEIVKSGSAEGSYALGGSYAFNVASDADEMTDDAENEENAEREKLIVLFSTFFDIALEAASSNVQSSGHVVAPAIVFASANLIENMTDKTNGPIFTLEPHEKKTFNVTVDATVLEALLLKNGEKKPTKFTLITEVVYADGLTGGAEDVKYQKTSTKSAVKITNEQKR